MTLAQYDAAIWKWAARVARKGAGLNPMFRMFATPVNAKPWKPQKEQGQ